VLFYREQFRDRFIAFSPKPIGENAKELTYQIPKLFGF